MGWRLAMGWRKYSGTSIDLSQCNFRGNVQDITATKYTFQGIFAHLPEGNVLICLKMSLVEPMMGYFTASLGLNEHPSPQTKKKHIPHTHTQTHECCQGFLYLGSNHFNRKVRRQKLSSENLIIKKVSINVNVYWIKICQVQTLVFVYATCYQHEANVNICFLGSVPLICIIRVQTFVYKNANQY